MAVISRPFLSWPFAKQSPAIGRPLAEPYVRFNDSCNIAPGQLGANGFVVAGDNRRDTLIAVVNRQRILGRIVSWHTPQVRPELSIQARLQ